LAQQWEWQCCWHIVGSMMAAVMTLVVLPRRCNNVNGAMMAVAK
jgi:hypothetical protein